MRRDWIRRFLVRLLISTPWLIGLDVLARTFRLPSLTYGNISATFRAPIGHGRLQERKPLIALYGNITATFGAKTMQNRAKRGCVATLFYQ